MSKRNKLLAFVATKHEHQVRKYTGEPYLNHLISVANMADAAGIFLGYEVGLCHDLFEDTNCRRLELFLKLIDIGYVHNESQYIISRVIDLTDVFTPNNFPTLNRKARKELEASRLHDVHDGSQSVKYCDLLDNASSILAYDPAFGARYIIEMRDILIGMCQGNRKLYHNAFFCLIKAEQIAKGFTLSDLAIDRLAEFEITNTNLKFKSLVTAFAKAFQNPEPGYNRLTRIGVTFTWWQRFLIRWYFWRGKMAKAQKIVLNVLKSKP